MLFVLAISASILNLVDAFFTCYFIQNGIAREVNPIMAKIMGWSLLGFVLFKIFISYLIVCIPWLGGKLAKYATYLILTAYSSIVLWHLLNFIRLIVHF